MSSEIQAAPAQKLCPHFGACGGCATQDRPYIEQVAAKQQELQERFADVWNDEIPVLPSPIAWHYRNKVDFNFGLEHFDEPPTEDVVRDTFLGFTHKGQWYNPIDIETCLIAPEGCDALLESVRDWYRHQGLSAHSSRSKSGFLRTLLVREGRRTSERMVVLFTSPGDFDSDGFVEVVQRSFPSQSIYRGTFSGAARGTFADRMTLLHGEEYIHEEMKVPTDDGPRSLRFRISPFSFFQTNTLAAEVLYGEIRHWVQAIRPNALYDLFGGAGGIAFSCSDIVGIVRSVENEPAATADGEFNATMNGVDNVFFTNAKMRIYLRDLVENGGVEKGAAVVVDPPRAGMTPKPLARLIASAPEHILYVSCKASALREELDAFLTSYRLERLWAVDLFPHTPHVEVLASLRLR